MTQRQKVKLARKRIIELEKQCEHLRKCVTMLGDVIEQLNNLMFAVARDLNCSARRF